MANGRSKKPQQSRSNWLAPIEASAPGPNVTSEGANENSMPAASDLPAGLYLAPLARLFDLTSDLDELFRGRGISDPLRRAAKVKSVLRTLADEKRRLRLINQGMDAEIQCRGGLRGTVIKAEQELSAKAAANYDPDEGLKRQFRRLLLICAETAVIYGTDFSEVVPNDEDRAVLMGRVEKQMNEKPRRRQSAQSKPSGGSAAMEVYVGPIQGLARALAASDVNAVFCELWRVSAHGLARIERLSAEFDGVCALEQTRGNLRNAESHRVRLGMALESERCKLIRQAIAGIIHSFGGPQRILMESFRKSAKPVGPTDPRVNEILDRYSEEMLADARKWDAQSDE
jgi:hypothetical protein